MKVLTRAALACFTLSAMLSCAPTRFVKPLEKNQSAVNVAAGGQLISFSDLVIPIPFVTATYGYGLDSSLTGFASLNLTSLAYGNAQVELGVTKRLLKQSGARPGVSICPVINAIYRNKSASKLYPQVDLNMYWEYNRRRNLVYAGLSNWFEFSGRRAFDLPQRHHWIWTPMIGETFVRRRWEYNVELKLIAPNIPNNRSTVDYKSPFGTHGALGIYLGCTRKF